MSHVSVVIPSYNQGRFVRAAVDSVLSQTYPNVNVIVVDDGSDDDTRDVVLGMADARVKYVRQKNAGPAAARNTGARLATGELLAFLDADDSFLPYKIERQAALIGESDLVAGGWNVVAEDGRLILEERPWLEHPKLDARTWLFGCPQLPSSVLIRRSAFERVGGFDERIHGVEDWDLFLRLALAGCQMTWLREIVSTYRMHAGQMTLDAAKQTRDLTRVLDHAFANRELPADLQSLRHSAYAFALLRKAHREYRAGQLDAARADLARAIQLDPALTANRGEMVFNMLVAAARHPSTPDPLAYIRTSFDHLPDDAARLRQRRREALAAVAMANCFEAHAQNNWDVVAPNLMRAIGQNPSWLRNRGVQSLLVRTLLRVSPGRLLQKMAQ